MPQGRTSSSGATCAIDRATSTSAPSTRSACHCFASFPLEANLDPGFRDGRRDAGAAPDGGGARSGARHRPRPCANRRLRPPAVCRAPRAEAAGWPREHDRSAAGRGRRDRARACVGPARPHCRDGVRGRVRAAPWCVHRSDRRRRRISRERTDSPPPMGHLLRRHAIDCQRNSAGARPRARGARPRREPLPQQGQTAPAAVRWVFREGLQKRGRVEDSPVRRARRGRRGRERSERIPARSECGVVARQ